MEIFLLIQNITIVIGGHVWLSSTPPTIQLKQLIHLLLSFTATTSAPHHSPQAKFSVPIWHPNQLHDIHHPMLQKSTPVYLTPVATWQHSSSGLSLTCSTSLTPHCSPPTRCQCWLLPLTVIHPVACPPVLGPIVDSNNLSDTKKTISIPSLQPPAFTSSSALTGKTTNSPRPSLIMPFIISAHWSLLSHHVLLLPLTMSIASVIPKPLLQWQSSSPTLYLGILGLL